MTISDIDEEVLTLVAEAIPPGRRSRLKRSASLKELGLDSLALMIVISRFLELHPLPAEELELALPRVKTVEELIVMARSAVARSTPTQQVDRG